MKCRSPLIDNLSNDSLHLCEKRKRCKECFHFWRPWSHTLIASLVILRLIDGLSKILLNWGLSLCFYVWMPRQPRPGKWWGKWRSALINPAFFSLVSGWRTTLSFNPRFQTILMTTLLLTLANKTYQASIAGGGFIWAKFNAPPNYIAETCPYF